LLAGALLAAGLFGSDQRLLKNTTLWPFYCLPAFNLHFLPEDRRRGRRFASVRLPTTDNERHGSMAQVSIVTAARREAAAE
jgi:hypothetical protein